MTSDRIFNAIGAYLQPLVEADQGVFSPSETVADTMAMLAASPTRWRCILQWQREDDVPNARGVMQAKFLVIVQQARGLQVEKGADITLSKDGKDALLKRFNKVAGWVRGLRFSNEDTDQQPMKPAAFYWLNDPTFPTRQIAGEFTTSYALTSVPLATITIL